MAILAKLFTWWNGATVGTSFHTWLRGEEVGRDDSGNIYYQGKKDRTRRWVIYPADNDGSRVPPEWSAWLRGTIDGLPDKSLPAARPFQKPAIPNATGTMAAYRPDGSLGANGVRAASTGDYQPWTPD